MKNRFWSIEYRSCVFCKRTLNYQLKSNISERLVISKFIFRFKEHKKICFNQSSSIFNHVHVIIQEHDLKNDAGSIRCMGRKVIV